MPTRDEAWPAGTPCWVDLSADDPKAAADFYSQLFGWDVQEPEGVTEEESGGYLMANLDGHTAAGIGGKPAPEAPSNWSTYFASDDVDATAAAVKDAGGALHMDPFDVMGAGRMFFGTAPDGSTFGVWQAGEHNGAGVFNQPGAYAWNELHSRDLDPAKTFYGQVFGYEFDDMSNDGMTYFGFRLPENEGPSGGMGTADMLPDGAPSMWLTWFGVSSCDETVAKAKELGGSVITEPSDSPFGRMSVLTGAEGEVFGVIGLEEATAPAEG
jgi:predicted enzyme related to lactoylglutathione lyase